MTAEEIVAEREDYEELLGTPGWRRFVANCLHDHEGAYFQAKIGKAIASGDPVAPRVVYEVSMEIQRILQAVVNRLAELKGDV